MIDRRGAEEALAQAERDLSELTDQIEWGEISASDGAPLLERYRRDVEHARRELAAAEIAPPDEETPVSRSPRRMLVGAGLLVVSIVAIIAIAASLAEERTDAPLEGIAAGEGVDLDSISNEAMEAVIESYRGDPDVAGQLPFMEFRLAERYFEEQDYLAAFPHYQAIIEGEPPADLYVQSMTRVGWIVWILNGETDLAIQTLDRAIDVDPTNPLPLYVKGQIAWCGVGDTDTAVSLFQRVLESDELDDAVRSQVEDDLAIASAGGACTS